MLYLTNAYIMIFYSGIDQECKQGRLTDCLDGHVFLYIFLLPSFSSSSFSILSFWLASSIVCTSILHSRQTLYVEEGTVSFSCFSVSSVNKHLIHANHRLLHTSFFSSQQLTLAIISPDWESPMGICPILPVQFVECCMHGVVV